MIVGRALHTEITDEKDLDFNSTQRGVVRSMRRWRIEMRNRRRYVQNRRHIVDSRHMPRRHRTRRNLQERLYVRRLKSKMRRCRRLQQRYEAELRSGQQPHRLLLEQRLRLHRLSVRLRRRYPKQCRLQQILRFRSRMHRRRGALQPGGRTRNLQRRRQMADQSVLRRRLGVRPQMRFGQMRKPLRRRRNALRKRYFLSKIHKRRMERSAIMPGFSPALQQRLVHNPRMVVLRRQYRSPHRQHNDSFRHLLRSKLRQGLHRRLP